jgi:hypothetical protein
MERLWRGKELFSVPTPKVFDVCLLPSRDMVVFVVRNGWVAMSLESSRFIHQHFVEGYKHLAESCGFLQEPITGVCATPDGSGFFVANYKTSEVVHVDSKTFQEGWKQGVHEPRRVDCDHHNLAILHGRWRSKQRIKVLRRESGETLHTIRVNGTEVFKLLPGLGKVVVRNEDNPYQLRTFCFDGTEVQTPEQTSSYPYNTIDQFDDNGMCIPVDSTSPSPSTWLDVLTVKDRRIVMVHAMVMRNIWVEACVVLAMSKWPDSRSVSGFFRTSY